MNKQLPFTEKTKMADVILRDFRLIPIIGRFGIQYGFNNKTVQQVCEAYSINVWFFLEIINSYHNHDYFPKKKLQNFNIKVIVSYLSKTHAYYVNHKIPDIQALINKIEESVSTRNYQNIKLLNDFFRQYCVELYKHLEKEDKQVFPYVQALEEMVNSGIVNKKICEQVNKEPIEQYEDGHENMEVKLSDLKNLIIRYLPPIICQELCQKLLTEVFRLETDLNEHSRIEELVLVPKVKILEKKALDLCEL